MQKRTLKVALLAVVALVLVLGFSGTALAATWSDLPATVTAKYGITNDQVAAISDGYPDGTWRPFVSVSREQYAKMAVLAFDIPLMNPATPSFTDVPKSSIFYQYIEGAKAAGIINGTTGTTFSPKATITRVQAIAIVSRYIADVQGYDLATMYTPAEIAGLLAHFGDAASIPAEFKTEVAFAFDFGITNGDAYGNLAPAALLTRIQGAAFLIRAQEKVPPAVWTAEKIEIVSGDMAENLIGKTHTVTFKVTDAAGHPAVGALVDFDTLYANPLYVGNISPQAAVTDSFGEVQANLVSHEPGTQKISATVKTVDGGLATVVATKYWVAMDEIYILDEELYAENNAGDAHEWAARVVVFGPGPRSTSQYDWYNVIDAAYDPSDLQTDDGWWDKGLNDYADELDLDADEMVRTMAGIGVQWDIVSYDDDDDSTTPNVASVGNITELDGMAITPAKSALGMTDDEGMSSITIYSEQIGETHVQAMATYPENPYPQMLIDRDTIDGNWDADEDWEQQPKDEAYAIKLWIPHVIGGDDEAPITAAGAGNNTGEVETYTLTLEDVYGNPIEGYTVAWWIQGVGEFKADGTSWSGIGEQNKDYDITDAAGQAQVWVKSLIPGQTIVHCKVMDKYGLPFKEWNVAKQWYSIDSVEFLYGLNDEIPPYNVVNTGHTFNVGVAGVKWVHVLYDVNKNGLSDDVAMIGDRDALKAINGGNVIDWEGRADYAKVGGVDLPAGRVLFYHGVAYTRFADMEMAANEFMGPDDEGNGIDVVWAGLAGKTVYFFNNVGRGSNPTSNTPIPTQVNAGKDMPFWVGTITSVTPVATDAMGMASVAINSTMKGYQWVYAVADYMDNPQDGNPLKPLEWAELRYDSAEKVWTPDVAAPQNPVIYGAGETFVAGNRWVNPVDPDWAGYQLGQGEQARSEESPNTHTFAVQVFDQYGNALPDYRVEFEILGQGTTTQGQMPTYHPYAHFSQVEQSGPDSGIYDRGRYVDANKLWDSQGDPAQYGKEDDDYAIGYTQDYMIDFEFSTLSAAWATMVLDESYDALAGMYEGEGHFTNIVNIKVFYPEDMGGGLFKQYEVTKVWTLEDAVLESISIEGALTDTGPWSQDPRTIDLNAYSSVYIRGMALDQFGNIYDPAEYNDADLKVRVVSNDPAYNIIWAGAFATDGVTYVYDQISGITDPNTATIQAWIDADGDNVIDATEIQSNILNAEFILGPGIVPEP